MIGFMVLCVVFCFSVCAMGLQGGVEKITKLMMVSLLVLMVVLAINSVRMEGSRPGLEFYLKPDFNKIKETGIGEVVFAALGQSFFTLSIGIGALAIFGSYIGKERRLTGEAINVTILDTFVAFMAGLIIFPACFAYNIEPGQGPSLIFITLPNVFNNMPGGRFWGTLFFLCMFVCGGVYGDCRIPEYRFLCNGSHGLQREKGGCCKYDSRNPFIPSLCSGIQCLE